MTESYFFDTDCISAFLWVNEQSILSQLYPGHIVIPEQVYLELSNPCVSQLKNRLDKMVASKEAIIESIPVDTEAFELYKKFTQNPDINFLPIGNGEAAGIALAKTKNGILASNNLKDVKKYVDFYKLRHVTTADIMKQAFEKQLISEDQGNKIWKEMLDKKRKLGYQSFTEVLENGIKDNNEK